jgi:hypothetical protein
MFLDWYSPLMEVVVGLQFLVCACPKLMEATVKNEMNRIN